MHSSTDDICILNLNHPQPPNPIPNLRPYTKGMVKLVFGIAEVTLMYVVGMNKEGKMVATRCRTGTEGWDLVQSIELG